MSSNPSPEQSLDKQPPAPQQQPVPPANIHAGFDPHSGQSWLFPVDFVTPDYLPLIVEKTLYHNSLVILPNRFEVSFVAAVVMHNVYRWYPFGKVVFICSNRKATQDQRAACDRLMKFVPSDVVDMALKPHERVRNWATKRAFFITSHTMAGEMARQEAERVAMRKIKLVVIEDPQLDVRAHSAIIQKLTEMGANFRVLCVTTTHGKTVEPAQLKQWHISNIELQWGNPQEKPDEWLMNKKEISNIVTVLGTVMDGLLAELQLLTQRYLANLHACKQIANTSLFETITADHIRQERTRYELSVLTGVVRKNHFEVMRNFHMAEKLVLAHRILARDGVVALMDYFHLQNDALGQADSELTAFLHKVRQGVYTAPHPKFTTLDNFLREFFQQRTSVVAAALRILIVVERTDAVLLVNRILKNIPESKHRCLIDSNYASYVDQFRTGELNVLVVPVEIEPSIELGHTDLVVLFNITDHPLEFLCHIARTRGGQPGAIVTMTTEGPEQEEITEIINNRRMHYYENRDILPIGVDLSDSMVRGSPALIPPGFQPKGRHVLFNRQATTVVEATSSCASPSPTLLPISPQLVVAEKRRVLEVLSDSPATYDAINGCTYYQVMQVPSQPSLVRTPGDKQEAEEAKSPGGGQ
ncbi:conserved hypothetical protein [Culex quinquefasciatus]|uniref:Uncharacterized protein n=1 Tax=Culex quinquefasciatus TaxID=7176 RepID=B0X8N9_CULQU|nr:ATP-dependent DNA helicase mph1 [Culex quinquefasciatus]EDS42631.1 conserved hypothetical protein [Culex quinquefasciatus]|eukprot:XP_001866011.1 conserved hypothetical protein [Culex quinquefasciatus]